MNNRIKIVKARPEDAKGMLQVYYKTWLATYPNKKYKITVDDIEYRFKDRFTKKSIEERKKKIRNSIKTEMTLVAKDKEKIIGVCGVNKNSDQNKLRSIYVLPEYQGQGIGKMFWNKVLKFFNPKNKTIVQVATYNKNAIAFYKKCGFIDTKKRFTDEKHRMKSGSIIPEMEMKLKL